MRVALLAGVAMCLPAWPQDTGEDLYRRNCVPCHGPNGEGGKGPSLQVLTRGADEVAISQVIRAGVPGAAMPAFPFPAERMRALVEHVQRLSARAASFDAAQLARGEAAVRGKGGCLRCHTIRGEGGVAGPDLTRIGLMRTREHLRRSLVEPEAEVADRYGLFHWYVRIKDDFLWVRVTRKDGSAAEGGRLNEDPFTLQMRTFDGALLSFDKSEVTIEKRAGRSPMPAFANTFSAAELNDVAVYLSSLRGQP